MSLRNRDRITVEKDGEEIEVFNWVTVKQPAIVRGSNPVVDKADPKIGAGDSMMDPDAVTEWVAEEVWAEYSIDVEDQGIDVIDPIAEEVTVL